MLNYVMLWFYYCYMNLINGWNFSTVMCASYYYTPFKVPYLVKSVIAILQYALF